MRELFVKIGLVLLLVVALTLNFILWKHDRMQEHKPNLAITLTSDTAIEFYLCDYKVQCKKLTIRGR